MAGALKATVNCDMGEGYSLYKLGDDAGLMRTIHLANVACGFHASDFSIMDETVALAKAHGVRVGAHPSLPDRQGFGRREMAMEPEELTACFIYQIGALAGFLRYHGLPLNHVKPHGAIYGQTARSMALARGAVKPCVVFDAAFMGLAGTMHQAAAAEAGVPFIAEWFADLEYSDEGKLLITKKHKPVELEDIRKRVKTLLDTRQITTESGALLPLPDDVEEVSICCHSDTPDAGKIAECVKKIVDDNNERARYS
ncbi:LamB/YcsF [Auriscalpium vulgare]|uniref:LamB/YcsF n=1 Tax=Auriscalpium vulgare TaxID=40419 RepID=A0ACB8RQU7_9AGAM|nr:LamB/YcsF [Auriscalpium vulgare]